jgi:TonB-dependent SusC/RagA subfamily outer membrane receptor
MTLARVSLFPAVALTVLLVSPSDAHPQAVQAPLQGVVVDDQAGQPVAGAIVAVSGVEGSVTTSRWGGFAFPDAPFGRVELHVSAPGHPTVVQEVEVQRGRVAFVRIVLPSVAAVLSELFVQVTPDAPGVKGEARTAADLLALQVPRTRVNPRSLGKSDYQIQLRSATSISGNQDPLILIDGVVVSSGAAYDALLGIPASDVESIEVLKGPAAASLYPYAANGVIHVHTKKGPRRR